MHRMYNTKVNLNANHGRWMTMMCRFINYNRCITHVGVSIVEEAMPVCVQGVCWKPLYFPLNFAVNLKLPQE